MTLQGPSVGVSFTCWLRQPKLHRRYDCLQLRMLMRAGAVIWHGVQLVAWQAAPARCVSIARGGSPRDVAVVVGRIARAAFAHGQHKVSERSARCQHVESTR